MIREDEIKVRKIRGWILNIFTLLFFGSLTIYLLNSMQELLLPLILGAFLAYLFRPLFRMGHGPRWKKYFRLTIRLGLIVGIIYGASVGIRNSLPNEKQELELLVRLQYRLNLRYNQWMGITKEKPEGNFVYANLGQELDPIISKINHLISLDQEQRRLFLQYRNSESENSQVSDKYFEYFLSNLKVMQLIEQQDEIKSQMEAVGPATAEVRKGGGLAGIMRGISIWLVFPLTFIFFLFDRGQIVHFFMKLIPNRYFELSKNVIDKMDDALGHYIRGTMLQCALVGLTIMVGLWLCGFELNVAVLVGFVGGLTNAIPFVGPAMACVVGSVFALITEEVHPVLPFINESNLILAVFVVVLIANLLDNAVYQPLVVGSAVNIHPLAVILGVFGGSLSFGFAGLLLAIPVIVILKVVTENLYQGLRAYRII